MQALLAAVHEEGNEAVREARRKEEERLSENRRVADILAENERLVAAEAKRRDEEERCLPSVPRPVARSPLVPRMVPTHAAPTPRTAQAKSTAAAAAWDATIAFSSSLTSTDTAVFAHGRTCYYAR